jgi:D-arabinose 1-dehydrogenase
MLLDLVVSRLDRFFSSSPADNWRTGYPLPTLLRLARLVKFHLQPLDIMQSYCHHTLQNTTLSTFLPLFHEAGVKRVITASPLK